MQALRHFLLAVQFFSRIPVTGRLAAWVGWSPALQRASAAHLPGVGWLVGLWGALWLLVLAWWLGASAWMPLVAALGSTAATLALTGAFHEDGLADVADGLGGHLPPERALEVMKDSRVGAYGVMALVVALGSKVALLALLIDLHPPLAAVLLLSAHVLSRLAPLVLMRWLPYVGLQAQSKTLHVAGIQLPTRGLCIGIAWCLPVAVLAAALCDQGLWVLGGMVAAAALVVGGLGHRLRRRLGGMTGDCLGACQQLTELALLLAASGLVLRMGLAA